MMKKKEWGVFIGSLLVFIWFGWYSIVSGVTDYVNDAIVSIIVVTFLFLMRKKLNLSTGVLASVAGAFVLHDVGVFGFYNQSPIGMQWDHLTHLGGAAAFMGVVFAYMQRFFTKERFHNGVLLMLMILVVQGIGVIIEFYEFAGFFIVGEGMGGLGHGLGDIVTELGNSEWFNTMFDLIYNVIGSLGALVILMFLKKRQERIRK